MSAERTPAHTTPDITAAPYASVLSMAGPLVISFWMRAAFTLVDTIYAATIGDAAVAAIGLTVPFEFFMIALWIGLSTGLTSALSRAMGAREGRKIEQYKRAGWSLALWVSPFFLLVGAGIWFGAPRMELAADVAGAFAIYGTTLIAGSAFTTFWSIIPDSVVKAHHDTRSTMWAGIWSNLINLTLNTVFVFVFHWGVFGIALSTVIGRIGGLVYALDRARRHEERRIAAETSGKEALDPKPYAAIFSLAIPASLTFMLMAAETAIVNYLLAHGSNPTESIAAYSIFYRVALFMFNPIIAMAVAMLPYVARRYGEGDFPGIRRGLREAWLASLAYSLLFVAPVLIVLSGRVAHWLSESALTAEYASFCLKLVPLVCLLGSPFILIRPVFEGMGKGRPGLVVAFLRYVVLTGPALWLGIRIAEGIGQPAIYGVAFSLGAVALVIGSLFAFWLRRMLAGAESSFAPVDSRTAAGQGDPARAAFGHATAAPETSPSEG